MSKRRIETEVIHGGAMPMILDSVSMPIFQSSTFAMHKESSYHDLKYIRLNNTPNQTVLAKRIALLEDGEAAVVTASGMAAISAVLLSTLRSGDHALALKGLYGGTHTFFSDELPGLGIEVDFVDGNDPKEWANKIKDNTKVFYAESITNPLLEVVDLEAITKFSRDRDLVSIIDNTFATPVFFKPLSIGFDVVVHSCTKYLNGHNDIVAGAIIANQELVQNSTAMLNHLGGSLDPHACFLLERGMKTLPLRLRQQSHNALALATFLEEQPQITKVHYPGLPTHPAHERAARLFGGFGGVLSFEIEGGAQVADELLDEVSIPTLAPSLGGVETLIVRPAASSHLGMSAKDRSAMGITDGLIRVALGIEATDDLLEDFAQALSKRGSVAA